MKQLLCIFRFPARLQPTLLIAMLLGFAAICTAQSRSDFAQVTWGDDIEATKKATLKKIIGHDEGAYYSLIAEERAYGKNKYTIQKFNKEMKLMTSADLNLEHKGNKLVLIDLLLTEGRIWQFDSYHNRNDDRAYVFVTELDTKTLTPISQRKKITDFRQKGVLSLFGSNDQELLIEMSDSKNYIGIQVNSKVPQRQQERFDVLVFDSDMELVWETKVKLPWIDRFFDVNELDIDNNGNAYLSGKRYKKKAGLTRRREKSLDGTANFDHRILKLTGPDDETQDFVLDLGDKIITSLTTSLTPDNEIHCAGFYTENRLDRIGGTCFLAVDSKNGNTIKTNTKDFSVDMIKEWQSEKHKEKAEKREDKGKNTEFNDFRLEELLPLANGGAYMIGERFFTLTSTTSDGNGNTTTTVSYHYTDIMVVRLSPEGIVEWINMVPKRQSGQPIPFFSSFGSVLVDETLYLIYNDSQRNLLPNPKRIYSMSLSLKDNCVTIAKLTSNGELAREVLFRREEIDVALRPVVCEQIDGNSAVIFGEFKKLHRFAVIDF